VRERGVLNNHLRSQLSKQTAAFLAQAAEQQSTDAALQLALGKLAAQQASIQDLQLNITELKNAIAAAEEEARELKRNLESARNDLYYAGEQEKILVGQLAAARQQIDTLTAESHQRDTAAGRHSREILTLTRSLAVARQDAELAKELLASCREKISRIQARHLAEVRQLRVQLKRARQKNQQLGQENKMLRADTAASEASRSRTQNQKRKTKAVWKRAASDEANQRRAAVTELACALQDLEEANEQVASLEAEKSLLEAHASRDAETEGVFGRSTTSLRLVSTDNPRLYNQKCKEILRALLLSGLSLRRVVPTFKAVCLALNIEVDRIPSESVVRQTALQVKVLTGAHCHERIRLIQEDDDWQVTLHTDGSTKAGKGVFATALEARRVGDDGEVERLTTVLPFTQPRSGTAAHEKDAVDASFNLIAGLAPDSRQAPYAQVDLATASMSDTALPAIKVATELDFTSEDIFLCAMHGE